MITVTEAKRLIAAHTSTTSPVMVSLIDAAGRILAEDIHASLDIPAYAQSSMDGYAISWQDWQQHQRLKIKGEVAAGSKEVPALVTGEAIRIFTGAPIPYGADTVIMQEKTSIEDGYLIIKNENLSQGMHVRHKGAEIKTGELALKENTLLTPAAIGFLAGLGITEVRVYPIPTIAIIITGNELQPPGKPLLTGQVYESNSFSLQAALKQAHASETKIYYAADKLETVRQVLKIALQESDLILVTGGVSVGDYDFVAEAAAANGIERIFHRVKQKPGKPIYFGKKDHKLVFGLPGNPASVLSCFYEYVEPAFKQISKNESGVRILSAELAAAVRKPAGLTHFLKGYYDGKTVIPLSAQESYRLISFANANCIIKIDEEVTNIDKGQMIEIHLLPQ